MDVAASRSQQGFVRVPKLVREWIDLRSGELQEDWELAQAGKELKKISPLD